MWRRRPWLIPHSLKLSLMIICAGPRWRLANNLYLWQAEDQECLWECYSNELWFTVFWYTGRIRQCFDAGLLSVVTHFAAKMQKTARHKSAELDFSPDTRPWWGHRERTYEIIVQQRSKCQSIKSGSVLLLRLLISSFILALKAKMSKQPTEERTQKKKKMWRVTRLVRGYFGSE